ncbi:MAG TPA: alpha/beta fold hydrolase [Anaeromyxobacteraceae bacterium]|nr:alpha/beta fold hydrolase [Anaeromyxobacteraceae bacterium]
MLPLAAPGPPSHPPWPIWLWVGVAVALLLAAGVAWLWWRRARRPPARRRRRREAKPRYPVVLCHGLFGFDEIEVAGARHAYFRGVPERLQKSSWEVSLPRLPGGASVKERAAGLAEWIRTIEAPRVNVLAHSMGGIDARYAISRLGLSERVAALVTVGAPHRGTPVADLGQGLAARLGLRFALERAGIGLDALRDLTVAAMEAFNAEVPDAPGVAYGSVVGVARGTLRVNPLLVPTWLYLKKRAGDNDGVVPASSQRWGEVLAEIEADHWAQIGWSRSFDAAEFYARLLRELRGRGF